jgi:hypothetical protein
MLAPTHTVSESAWIPSKKGWAGEPSVGGCGSGFGFGGACGSGFAFGLSFGAGCG